MPPIHEYSNWNLRSADTLEEIEPLRKFVFICEGSKTEDYYFKELINPKSNQIHHYIATSAQNANRPFESVFLCRANR